jgi:hypothetical protein
MEGLILNFFLAFTLDPRSQFEIGVLVALTSFKGTITAF